MDITASASMSNLKVSLISYEDGEPDEVDITIDIVESSLYT